MSISYLLAPIPKWYIADLTGRPLGGGSMFTFRSLNKTQLKFIFQDPAGVFPWPDPVLFDENGSQGPFYWEVDTDHPEETYYIEVYDADGVLQWTIDNFAPPGGGGGSIITTALDLENLIANNVFWRNTGVAPIATVTKFKLCPGAHAALADTPSNAGPDILFLKNNTNATDTIAFPRFPLGSTPLTGDVTPVDYLEYACTNTPSGETFKLVQFPITQGVQNLSNQEMSVTIWAKGNSGTTTLDLQWLQFFGDGAGASPSVVTTIASLSLTNAWVKYGPFSVSVPDVSGKVLGACGNDGLFLQVQFPLGASCNIDFTKPSVYLGNISPQQDYHTYDMIDALINAPRTGYITSGFDLIAPNGYVIMNDGTIGSAASGATTFASTQTFPLYNVLWNNVSFPSSNAWCPVTGGLGASSIADFTANKPLAIPRALGRLLGSAGSGAGLTNRVLGSFLGTETISIADMPAHTHPPLAPGIGYTMAGAGAGGTPPGGNIGSVATTGSTGGSAADGKMPPVTFMNWYIKL